jgi:hypothetical protein
MPSCVPVWHGGDNGGATMTGVTASKVNFLVWAPMANAQVNAILAQDDLAANPNQFCPAYQAFTDDLNKRWELYGRKLTPLDGPGNHSGLSQNGCSFPYFQSQCQSLPPDPPCLRAEADVIASMHPAFVIAPISVSALYDELGRKKIVVAGGQAEPDQYHDAVAPYYWDVFMGGTRLARMAADYWCKKLVGQPVRYAGSEVLHPDGNPLGAVPKRKLGIVYPETNGDPTYKINIDEFQRLITGGECGSGADAPKRYTYQFDINTAEQQSLTTVAALKKDHITTMMCACDAIAPVFLTTTLAAQNYHPEQLLMGVGLMDYDALAQLYNGSVWKYAFGVSSLGDPVAFADSQAAVAWRDAGRQGLPDNTENLYWSYFVLMGNAFQAAGPRVTPGAIEQALFSLDPGGGDHVNPLIEFGRPNDHTGIRDSREVYWCTSPPSPINGHRGHYVSVDGGKRRQVGEWPSGDPAVFPNGPC